MVEKGMGSNLGISMSNEKLSNEKLSHEKLSDERLDRLCQNCGQAFSVFLNEMAEHNAKVAACPLCGKHHSHKPPKADKSAAAVRPLRKTASKR
jgi:hypothetical protein